MCIRPGLSHVIIMRANNPSLLAAERYDREAALWLLSCYKQNNGFCQSHYTEQPLSWLQGLSSAIEVIMHACQTARIKRQQLLLNFPSPFYSVLTSLNIPGVSEQILSYYCLE